jgi:hypothetical protein
VKHEASRSKDHLFVISSLRWKCENFPASDIIFRLFLVLWFDGIKRLMLVCTHSFRITRNYVGDAVRRQMLSTCQPVNCCHCHCHCHCLCLCLFLYLCHCQCQCHFCGCCSGCSHHVKLNVAWLRRISLVHKLFAIGEHSLILHNYRTPYFSFYSAISASLMRSSSMKFSSPLENISSIFRRRSVSGPLNAP